MRTRLIGKSTYFVYMLACTLHGAWAQTPAVPAPAGGLPAEEPFNTPYGPPIALRQANVVIQTAVAEATRRGWPEAVAVTDPNGSLIAFIKMDGAPNATSVIAPRKANTAARYRHDTRTFYNAFEAGHVSAATLDPDLVASPGGLPLVENGKIVGAIGCSGGTGDQDAAVCMAGANAPF